MLDTLLARIKQFKYTNKRSQINITLIIVKNKPFDLEN